MAEVVKAIEVTGGPRGTLRFTAPNWLILLLIVGGIGTNTVNIYLMTEQVDRLKVQIDLLSQELASHEKQPAHNSTARLLDHLMQRLDELDQKQQDTK